MLKIMSLNLRNGAPGGRWAGLSDLIRTIDPQVLLIQEAVGWADDGDPRLADAQRDLKLRGWLAASRTGFHTGILVTPELADGARWVTKYAHVTLHGHGELALQVPGLPKPLAVVCAHLSPWSAATAAQEAQLLLGRAHREGGFGVLGGDLNHLPLADPEPDWTRVTAANRAARTVASDPELRGDRSVGLVLARGDLVDTAAHLADQRNDRGLRAVTGHAGLIRTDQIHVTRDLLPALVDYQRVETGALSDHDAVVVTLDIDRLAAAAGTDSDAIRND